MPATAPVGFARYLYTATYPGAGFADSTDVIDGIGQQTLTLYIDHAVGGKRKEGVEQLNIDEVGNSFQAAIALAEQDPLLQCLSSWLNQDFDWQPVPHSSSKTIEPDLTLCSAKSSRHKIGLSFCETNNQLPVFPEEFNELVKLQAHKRPVSLNIASLQLCDADKQRLQPGSVVLLPDTFKDQCEVELLAAPSDKQVARAQLDHVNQKLYFSAEAMLPVSSASDEAANNIRVVLEQQITIDFSRLHDSRFANRSSRSDNTEAPVQIASVKLAPLEGQRVHVQQVSQDRVETYPASLFKIGSGLAAVLSGSN